MGRLVIPMEIRKLYGINDRDPLEIFTDNEGHIIIKKYEPLPEISNHIDKLIELINEGTNYSPEEIKGAVNLLAEVVRILSENVIIRGY